MATEWVSGNIFIRAWQPMKDSTTGGHRHNFDHTTIVFKGAVHVHAELSDGTILDRTFVAPTHFLVRKDVLHEIRALEEDTEYWCVYSHRSPQGAVVEEYDGWLKAYV
jgi:hypothetical protein